jgi:hypothetical protein
MKKHVKTGKFQMSAKMEDIIYAFVRPDDDNSTSCLRLNLEHTAKFNNIHVLYGDETKGIFTPPPCFTCIVDRSLVGKDKWDMYLKSIKTIGAEQKTVYIIIDKEDYSLPPSGTYIRIPVEEDNGSTGRINDTIRRLKFLADCEAGRENEHMPPGLDSVFAVTDDKKLRKTLIQWAAKNGCSVVWGDDKDFEIGLGTYPMCCVFDRPIIEDDAWKRYQDMLSPNINIIDEVSGAVIYSCVETEDDYYCITIDEGKSNPVSDFKKGVQVNIERKEVLSKIIGYLDEAKKYRDEIIWPRMRDSYKEDCLELLK